MTDRYEKNCEALERVAALLHEEATGEPWTVAGVEHPGPDRDYYRKLARKVLALAAEGEPTTPQPAQTLSDEHKAILRECSNQAMLWTLKARIPEAGAFGEIAQDLDYICEQLWHYECAVREIERLREEMDGLQEGMRALLNDPQFLSRAAMDAEWRRRASND